MNHLLNHLLLKQRPKLFEQVKYTARVKIKMAAYLTHSAIEQIQVSIWENVDMVGPQMTLMKILKTKMIQT